MAGKRRHLHRRRSHSPSRPIYIRVGSRRSHSRFYEIAVVGPRDAPRFARLVEDQVRAYPRDPLVIAVDGYQPWLENLFNTCIRDYWADISDLAREVQFASTMQFPEQASQQGDFVPWTFIIDQMNVPQVYYWSVDMIPPPTDDDGLPYIENFRFRIGAWHMGRNACIFNRDTSTTIIFTRPTDVSDHVVTELLFSFLYKDEDFAAAPRGDEEGICWIFLRLYWLLSDWQNIILALKARLKEAEENSHGKKAPVKIRARDTHSEIDRIYDIKEYLQFHENSFKKLQKLKSGLSKQEQDDPLWNDIDDATDDLDQYGSTIDTLKERFSNLLDLEFNIQNATQSDNSNFLSIIASLFLPVSYVASVFGITTITWPPIWYVYVAVPVLVVSVIFTLFFRKAVVKIQKLVYPVEKRRVVLREEQFTLLGQELPGTTDPGGDFGASRATRKKTQHRRTSGPPPKAARNQSRQRSEKGD